MRIWDGDAAGVVGALYCAGAVWSALGVQLFGGLVYDGNPDLEDTDYLDSHYDVRNCAKRPAKRPRTTRKIMAAHRHEVRGWASRIMGFVRDQSSFAQLLLCW